MEKDKMTDRRSHPIVVNTGSKLVVIDTGSGPAKFAQSKGAVGQFHDQSRRPPASTATRSTS